MEENFEVHDLYDDEDRVSFVEDEGDEDNLGVPVKDGAEDYNDLSTINDDVVDLNDVLDDSEYNDSSFDCD